MRISLTLVQLEAFAEVAQRRNFRAAAVTLHVSQPALSRTIRLAEAALDTRLFDRDTRRVELTAAGRELLPIAKRILADFNGAFSELAQFLEGRSGHVKVASLPSLGVAVLPATLAGFREAHPQARFSIIEGPADFVRACIEDGRADFGVTVRPQGHEPLRYVHCVDDPFVLLCRSDDPLAARPTATWSVFAGRPFIPSAGSSSIRPLVDAVFLQKRIQVEPALEFSSIAMAGALVRAGVGITALPRLALHLIAREGLAAVPLRGPSLSRPIGLVTRAGRSLSPITRAFMETLAKASY
jgi:DNA-binding transcriptional LysR family regulator